MAQENANNHFWQFEYYSVTDPDVECIRITYKNQPFHLITIDETSYVLAEDISRCLNLTDDEGVYMLDKIPDTEKTTRRMCRSNGDEYELALLTEMGLCNLISLLNTPEGYDFLKDIQELLQKQEKPSTDVSARIAERFAVAKRKRIEANPKKVQSMEKCKSQVLSSPSLYRGLERKPVVPVSVLTIAAAGTLQVYRDGQGNYWLESKSVLKAIGHSSIADPSTVFGNVPPCWLNDLIVDDADGTEQLIPCILLQGLLFYLAESDNLSSVYLMYYIALKLAMVQGNDPNSTGDSLPIPSFPLGDFRTDTVPAYNVRCLMDRQGGLWYIASDITKYVAGDSVEKVEDEILLQHVPDRFKMVMFVKSGDIDENVLCISEHGMWFFLSEYSEDIHVKEFIEWLIQVQPLQEDRLNMYRSTSGWRWPYLNGLEHDAPSYDSQLKGLEVILNAYNRKNLTEWGFWGLNAVAEMTTGISPLTIIQRWERNKEKDAGTDTDTAQQ